MPLVRRARADVRWGVPPRRRRRQFESLEPRCLLDAIGLSGLYFDSADLSGLKLSRVDAQVDFDWGSAAPHASVAVDTFSVRWTGRVLPAFDEVYSFYVTSDDGMRLWIDGQLILSHWTNHTADTAVGQISLRAGERYDIRLEYYDNTGSASVRLEWSSPSQPRQVVPAERLDPLTGTDDRGTILQEVWSGIAGSSLAALTGNSAYPSRPTSRDYLLSFESLQADWGDNYGQRVGGYLVPPLSGDYVLAVAGDDQAALYLSSDADPAHKSLIASAPSATAVRDFSALPSQRSAPVSLVAGQRYYVEALHKESTGTDHFSVGWQIPGSSQFVVIPGEALEPSGTGTVLPAQGSILATLATAHPRLLVTPERWEWVKRQVVAAGQMQTWYNSLRSSADAILTQALPAYDPDNRGTILGISRSVVDHMLKLAMVYRITGDTRYAERAWSELNAASAFPDWHPAHFLDTAEMTCAFAIGYDWLYDYWTAAQRTALVNAMVAKGLNPGLSVLRTGGSWSASTSNNWNLVCNGGLVLGALAIADQQAALAEELLARAVPSVRAILRHFTADAGGWYEGPGYWGYSTEYHSRLVAGLVSALGSDFGLSQTAGLADNGLFPLEMLGPSRTVFNFADASAGVSRGPQLFWYARRHNRPEYAWYERTYGAASVQGLLWYDSRGGDPSGQLLRTDEHFRGDTSAYATQDVVTSRGAWADPQTTFAAFKAGKVGDSHGNLDAGSFVLDALGQRWIHDLGGDDYALPGYFGSQRWDYYRMRAEGHNTLVINPDADQDQVVGAQTTVVRQESNADGSLSVADLTAAYSGVSRVWRGLRLSRWDGSLLVQDEIEAASETDVWSFFHVKLDPSQIEIAADGTSALLTTSAGRMWVKLLGSPGAKLELRDPVPLPTSPDPDGQNANAGYQKLAIHLTHVVNRRLAVWFVPLAPGREPPISLPAIEPLTAWQLPLDNRVWLGDVDGSTAGDSADAVAADPAWRSAVEAASGMASSGFDSATGGQVVPMSFSYTVPAGQQVVGGRLTLGLRATGSGSGDDTSGDRLFLEGTSNGSLYSALGWAAVTASPTARTLDLGSQLSRLQDGRLDVAVAQNTAIDWAVLDLRFGPTGQYTVATIYPEADAYVRSGAYANQNYPTGTLGVKRDSGDYGREAYLRFALDGVAHVASATLRLVPASLGVAAENRLAFVSNDAWAETGITWNNKPAADTPFASFAPQANVAAEFDVTGLVAAAVAGDRRLSLQISSSIQGADYWTYFASRENSNPQLRPQLQIVTLAAAADPILRINGDRDYAGQDDTIRLVGEAGYVSVFVNGQEVPEVRRDLATLQQIIADGRGAQDLLTIDASYGNPIPAGGLSYEGGDGGDTVNVAGPADAVWTGDQIDYAGSTITLAGTEFGGFSTRSLNVAAATLRLSAEGAIGPLTDLLLTSGGTLDLNGHSTPADAVALADGTITGGTLSGTSYIVQNGTVSASLAGSGTLTKNTTGKVVLSGANTFTGAVTVYQGILNVQHAQALGAATSVVTVSCDGATNRFSALELEGPDFTIADRPLNTTGYGPNGGGAVRNISGRHTWTGAVTLTGGGGGSTYQSDAGRLEFTGPIAPNTTGRAIILQGNGEGALGGAVSDGGQSTPLSVTKRGSGRWTLGGANTFSGATTVEAGTLLVEGTLAGGAVTVKSAATLGGQGTLGGTVAVNSGGTLAPAQNGVAGTLTVGNLTLAAGSLLQYDLTAVSGDRVAVNGTLTLNGGKLNLSGSGLVPATHTVIDYAGTLGGAFSNLVLGMRPDGYGFQLVNNLAATAVDLVLSNALPTITPLADQTIDEDTPAGPLAFTVGDLETPASQLEVTAWSSDPALVPPENITLQRIAWPAGSVLLTIVPAADRSGTATITVAARDGGGAVASRTFQLVVQPVADVVGRCVLYNNSAWDGNDPAATAADYQALAPAPPLAGHGHADETQGELGKQALLPGQTASFLNYTSYAKGLNGIVIAFDALAEPDSMSAVDFEFRVGNSDAPAEWAAAPTPRSVRVDENVLLPPFAGCDVVTITWADEDPGTPHREDGAISNQWLQIVVLANSHTGLAAADVFYFGNQIGESGNSATDANVDANDEIGARNHPHSAFSLASASDPYDFNRDRKVDQNDEILARNHSASVFTRIALIAAPYVRLFSLTSEAGQAGKPDVLPAPIAAAGRVDLVLGRFGVEFDPRWAEELAPMLVPSAGSSRRPHSLVAAEWNAVELAPWNG